MTNYNSPKVNTNLSLSNEQMEAEDLGTSPVFLRLPKALNNLAREIDNLTDIVARLHMSQDTWSKPREKEEPNPQLDLEDISVVTLLNGAPSYIFVLREQVERLSRTLDAHFFNE